MLNEKIENKAVEDEVVTEEVVTEEETVVEETPIKADAEKAPRGRFNKTNTDKKSGTGPFARRTSRGKTNAMGFEEKVVGLKRISKTTKGGRNMRFSALVVVGDKKGQVGYGIGKSTEVPNAIKKAVKNARNNISKVIMNKRGTIYHEVIGKNGASKVLIKPAPEGKGIVAGGAIRAVVELAGYKDLYTKNLGSNTALNMVQATIKGLMEQRHPSVIADLRDKKVNEL